MHLSQPAISVLIPYRNAEDTVATALESVLTQEGPPLEVLAVDDGSTDRGPEVVRCIATHDVRVRPLRSGGAGIARSLNLAARHAEAPLLARMDADDVCLPGRFESQVRALEGNKRLGAVGTRVEAFPDAAVGEGLKRYVAWQNALVSPEAHARDLFVESPLCHPSVMMRREAFEDVRGYADGNFAEDYDLWMRMHSAGWKLAKAPEVLLRWRHRPGRATFSDPRYEPACFRALKARHLAPWLRQRRRPIVLWGAGPTGRRFARALEAQGLRTRGFIDIDPRKVGRTARGAPIEGPDSLVRGRDMIVVAVGARGARQLIRDHLERAGFVEREDYVCAA